MHRSGTSALTRLLASLGCDLPKTLMEADAHNAMGYWESTEVANLNEAILESAGSSWDDWEAFDLEWYGSTVAEGFLDRAQAVLASEFGDSRLFVLKDPRICRLLQFWKEALDRIGAAPVVVLPVRNPLEVGASLRERDAIDPSVGMLIWLRNVLDAEADSRELQRSFVRYQDVLDRWKSLATRVGSELDVRWPGVSAVAEPEFASLISPSIRHHVLDDAHVHHDPLVSLWVKTVFEIFGRWSGGAVKRADAQTLDSIRSALNDSGPNFSRAIAIGKQAMQQNREYEARIEALDRSTQSLEQAVVSRDRQVADLDEAVRDRDQRIADRDRQLSSVSHSLSERDRQVADRDRRLDSVGKLLSERDRQVADRDRRLDSVSQLLGERDRQVAEQETRIAERDTRIAEQDTRIAERDTRIAELDTRIESLDRTVAERDIQIQAIYESTSWRITRPLRTLNTMLSRLVHGTYRFVSTAVFRVISFVWRLMPLGALRQRIKGPLLRLLPGRFVDRHLRRRRQSNRRYIASDRLQLADRNFDAVNNQGDTPVLFDPEYYLAANEDVRNSGTDPLQHYLAHGAVEGRLPFAVDPDQIDPVIEALHRIDLREDDVFTFDAGLYRDLYPDLAPSTDQALLDHYHNHGRDESRAGSRGEFVLQICDDPREIPLDFKFAEYVGLYPDLGGYAARSPLQALRHYMSHGRWEPRLHTWRGDDGPESRNPERVDLPSELTSGTRPICVLVHVYYPDLWEELAGYLANLPQGTYDLYVNLVETTFTAELERRIRETFPIAKIYVSENIGRDIGGHFRLLQEIPIETYRLFCLIHTKKSPHLAEGDALLWRRRLLNALMGSRELAVENLRLMLTDETVGLIGSRRCRDTKLRENAEKFAELLDLLGVKPDSREVEFLSGTMMYLRREVLQRVFEGCKNLPFEKGDDTPLGFHLDAQWAHAIERVIGNVVRDMNYRFEWR
ncbi:MAG: hypothetical protein OXI90_12540 [Gammaproteobacteria bacterium]|nr:hypothetical protein [Gammaproteobacteria bacterium]